MAVAQAPGAEPVASKDTTLVNSLIKQSASHFIDNRDRAMDLAIQARDLAEKVNFPEGQAYAFKNIGIVYYYQGKYLEALEQYNQSLKIFQDIKDNVGIANLYNNIGASYYNKADYARALENHL